MTRTISILSGLVIAAMLAASAATPAASGTYKLKNATISGSQVSGSGAAARMRIKRNLGSGSWASPRTATGVGNFKGKERPPVRKDILIYDIKDGFVDPPKKPNTSGRDTSKDDCMSCD